MKNTIKALAIIALVAVIGFSFAACGGGGDGDGGGGGGGGSDGGGGKLTVTGLPSGTYSVWVFTSGADISTYQKYNAAIDAGKCEAVGYSMSNNNVFDLLTKGESTFYTGSGSKEVCLWTGLQGIYATVNFSNGGATVPYSSFTGSFTNQ